MKNDYTDLKTIISRSGLIIFSVIIFMQLFHFSASAQTLAKSEEIQLWTNFPPDEPGPVGKEKESAKNSWSNISRPRLIVHRPEHPNGVGILVISGGGYAHIEIGNESKPAADWLASQGVTAFELVYRLPGEGWASNTVPFQDGQRAMRLIRSIAPKYQIDQHHIGVMGFSAGGHLAAIIATRFHKQFYQPVDSIDRLSARPDFAALLYPVITMLPPYNHTHSEKELLGLNPSSKQQKAYSAELHVTQETPPVFIAQALDDPISPVANSRLFFASLEQYSINAEIHLFKTGGHGWGMGKPESPVNVWPQLFKDWVSKNKIW